MVDAMFRADRVYELGQNYNKRGYFDTGTRVKLPRILFQGVDYQPGYSYGSDQKLRGGLNNFRIIRQQYDNKVDPYLNGLGDYHGRSKTMAGQLNVSFNELIKGLETQYSKLGRCLKVLGRRSNK